MIIQYAGGPPPITSTSASPPPSSTFSPGSEYHFSLFKAVKEVLERSLKQSL
jgi:hypothetical protein